MWVSSIIEFLQTYSATIIALSALCLTIQQGRATRRHNKLTVWPMLAVFSHKENHPDSLVIVSTLSNDGLGPAHIESFEYLIDGAPIIASEPEHVHQAITQRSPLRIIEWEFTVLRPRHVMGRDSSQQLFRVAIARTPTLTEAELERYAVRVVYKSAYGERFIYDSRIHDNQQ